MDAIETATTGYFESTDGDLHPLPHARSPWGADMLHGRLLGALGARAIELAYGSEEFLPSRLTVDLFRSPPMAPVSVRSELVRDGKRIKVADATLECGGDVVARASVVLLKTGEQPESDAWSAPSWDMPSPDDLPAPPTAMTRMSEMRSRPGEGMRGRGQRRVWLRDVRSLVDDEPLTPFVRAALAADYASPLANSGTGGLSFINADFTLYLSRLPATDWVGFEVADHLSSAGVAIARCRLYDEVGPLGFSDVCAVSNQMRSRGQ